MIEKFKLLDPTQKFIDTYTDGDISKNHKFWFNVDLLFIATKDVTDEQKRRFFKEYVDSYGINLTYEDFIKNFDIPFSVLIDEFKDVPEIYNSFNFKE
jgi:hypothetical protein